MEFLVIALLHCSLNVATSRLGGGQMGSEECDEQCVRNCESSFLVCILSVNT